MAAELGLLLDHHDLALAHGDQLAREGEANDASAHHQNGRAIREHAGLGVCGRAASPASAVWSERQGPLVASASGAETRADGARRRGRSGSRNVSASPSRASASPTRYTARIASVSAARNASSMRSTAARAADGPDSP